MALISTTRSETRKSSTGYGKIYFWTATINNWQQLLLDEKQKDVIISALHYLSTKGLVTVFGFVIMPNHLHLIWRLNKINGKESPKGSFMKFTAHTFTKWLKAKNGIGSYAVNALNKRHEIWQRDALGIEIWSKEVARQKLSYIHFNPVSGKWKLAKDDLDYKYSSARFYETGVDEFGFLSNIFDYFNG